MGFPLNEQGEYDSLICLMSKCLWNYIQIFLSCFPCFFFVVVVYYFVFLIFFFNLVLFERQTTSKIY